jgi:hypothetical protein
LIIEQYVVDDFLFMLFTFCVCGVGVVLGYTEFVFIYATYLLWKCQYI